MIPFIFFSILIYTVIGTIVFVITCGDPLEDDIVEIFPNLRKRILFVLMCGPGAWFCSLIFLTFSIFYFLNEKYFSPFMDWLKKE